MITRSFLICTLLSVILVKTHVINQRQTNNTKKSEFESKWELVETKLRLESVTTTTTSTTTATTTSTTFKPTTTRSRLTVKPELKGIEPKQLSRPVTNRSPLLPIQDPRPDVIIRKPYPGPTFGQLDYYKYKVTLKGFNFALTMAILANHFADERAHFEYSLSSSSFYNNAYRVLLRHVDSLQEWLSGKGSYMDSHKLWKKKLDHVNDYVPKWLRSLIPWVPTTEWDKEEEIYNNFQEGVDIENIFIQNPYYQGKGTFWEESKK